MASTKGEVRTCRNSPFAFGVLSFIILALHPSSYHLLSSIIIKEIGKVSGEEVGGVVRKYLNLQAYAVAIIRPLKEKRE